MIRVTVELIPGGRGEPQHLGTMLISKQPGSGERAADYMVRLYGKRKTPLLRGGFVRRHRRLSEPVWVLIRKALEVSGYGRDD